MTPAQAAKVIGCDVSNVRYLIRTGKLKAELVKTPVGSFYNVNAQSVRRYRDKPQAGGWTRGQKRSE